MNRASNCSKEIVSASRICRVTCVIFLVFAFAPQSQAVDQFWGNPLGGDFNVAGNWQGGIVPGTSDVARFGLTTNPLSPITYTVNFNTVATTTQLLKIEDDHVLRLQRQQL